MIVARQINAEDNSLVYHDESQPDSTAAPLEYLKPNNNVILTKENIDFQVITLLPTLLIIPLQVMSFKHQNCFKKTSLASSNQTLPKITSSNDNNPLSCTSNATRL